MCPRSPFPFFIAMLCHMGVERFVLILFVSFWVLISFVMDAPPIPRHGAPSTPGKPVRINIFPICARRAKFGFLHNPDRCTVSGKSAGIYLEILGRVGLSPQCRCEYTYRCRAPFGHSVLNEPNGDSRSPPLRSRYMRQTCHPALGATWILRSGSWREGQITRGTQG